MEIKTIVTVIIAGMLGAVVFAGILPVFADTSASTDEFTNEGYFHMEKYGTDTDITMVWDHTAPRKITVNDSVYDLVTPVNTWIDLIVGDDWFIRYAYGGSVSFMGFNGAGFTNQIMASVGNGSDMTAVISNGTVTVTVTTTGADPVVKSTTYTICYVISDDKGAYVMKKSDIPAYMEAESEIYAIGSSDVFGGVALYKLTGTIKEGVTVTPVKVPEGVTAGDTTINTDEVNNYVNTYKLDNIVFSVTDGDNDATITYSYFIVPYEIDGERAIHPDAPTTALLNLLPVLIAIGLIVGIAGAIFIKRM